MSEYKVLIGDCMETLKTLPDQSISCCVTSPPYYGLRDYGHDGQIGMEDTPDAYVDQMVRVFREVRRVLKDDGTLWLNLGDSYAGYHGNKNKEIPSSATNGWTNGTNENLRRDKKPQDIGLKPKDLIGIPWRVALALQADGWYLRQDIIWSKPNPMPESVTDRCTKAHEYIFLLSKSDRYYFNAHALKEPAAGAGKQIKLGEKSQAAGKGIAPSGNALDDYYEVAPLRNKRSVWTVSTKPYKGSHFATFPPDLIEPCILAGCPPTGKSCDCADVISTPLGTGKSEDPTPFTGRAGMNRERNEDEGVRPITKRTQRHHAALLKMSPHKEEMRTLCGSAFDHYIRTDDSGARPLPPNLYQDFLARGWISDPQGDCGHDIEEAGTVLDPFGGSGTTAGVALAHGRNAILCELNPEYAAMIPERVRSIVESISGKIEASLLPEVPKDPEEDITFEDLFF